MATVNTLAASGLQGNPNIREYTMEATIDFAEAATAKGSALVAGDSVRAFVIPTGANVLFAGLQVEAVASGGTGTVLDLGVDGGDTDAFVDGFTYDGAAINTYATQANTACPIVFGAGGNVDLLVQAATTVATAGRVRVYARVIDSSAIGDRVADAAARDQLA